MHDYTNRGDTNSSALGISGARVELYRGGDMIARYNVPNQPGTLWTVFELENDQLRWDSLALLIERKAIKYVHAKMYAFDEKGFETKLDYPKCIKQIKDGELDPILSIEWEGKLAGPIGVLKSYELLKYSLAQLKGEEYKIKTDFPDPDDFMDDLLS